MYGIVNPVKIIVTSVPSFFSSNI